MHPSRYVRTLICYGSYGAAAALTLYYTLAPLFHSSRSRAPVAISLALSLILLGVILDSTLKVRTSRVVIALTVALSYYVIVSPLTLYEPLAYLAVLIYLLLSHPWTLHAGGPRTSFRAGRLGFAALIGEHVVLVLLSISLAAGIALAVGGIAGVLVVDIPKPYYYVTSTLARSRLGILAIAGAVTAVAAWTIRRVKDLAVLYLGVERDEALAIVRTELYRESLALEEALPRSLRHLLQFSYVIFAGSIVWGLTFTLFTLLIPGSTERYSSVLYLVVLALSYVVYRLTSKFVEGAFTIEYNVDHVLYGLLGILLILLLSITFGGDLGVILLSSLTGAGYQGDPLEPFILVFEKYTLQAQQSFREFEEGLISLIRLLWG